MNRKEIKQEAKAKYKKNKLNIWVPLLLWGLIVCVIYIIVSLSGIQMVTDEEELTIAGSIYSILISMIQALFLVGYYKYMLNFVRTGNFLSLKESFSIIKESWASIILGYILISIFTSLGYILLIIPGIILALGFSMFFYIMADHKAEDAMDGVKKSWQLMKGYKWNFFVFNLSFIGWYLLCILTLGILLIWVIPYCNTAFAIYYDRLQQLTKE